MSASKPSIAKLRVGYYDDLTASPATFGADALVKTATARRMTIDEVRRAVTADELEVAFLPSAEALRLPNHSVIPCSCIASMGACRLFMLYSKKVPTEIKTVLVDQEDYGITSLARLVCAKKLMIRPEFTRSDRPLDPTTYNLMQDDGYDAYVVTGRNALFVRKDAFSFSLDLTLAWWEMTRLPFVIHTWMVKKGIKLGRLDKELTDVARRNDASAGSASKVAERYNVTATSVEAVYGRAIISIFDPNTVTSLRRFAQELAQNRIIPVQSVSIYTEAVVTKRPGAP